MKFFSDQTVFTPPGLHPSSYGLHLATRRVTGRVRPVLPPVESKTGNPPGPGFPPVRPSTPRAFGAPRPQLAALARRPSSDPRGGRGGAWRKRSIRGQLDVFFFFSDVRYSKLLCILTYILTQNRFDPLLCFPFSLHRRSSGQTHRRQSGRPLRGRAIGWFDQAEPDLVKKRGSNHDVLGHKPVRREEPHDVHGRFGG